MNSSLDAAHEHLDIGKYFLRFCIDEFQFIINKITLFSSDEIFVTFSDCIFTSFVVSFPVGDKISSEGREFSGCRNNSGPFHRSLWFNKSAAAKRLGAESTGVFSVGTFQLAGQHKVPTLAQKLI